MRNDLIQGRTPSERLAVLNAQTRLVEIACVAIGVLLVCSFFGCAVALAPFIPNWHGIPSRFHPDDITPCERGATGCTVAGEVYYSTFDPRVKAHEIEHVRGMRHGAWKVSGAYVCAVVTNSGKTGWQSGQQICRDSSGQFFRR